MNEKVKITVSGTQKDAEGNKNNETQNETGRYFNKGNASYVLAQSIDGTSTSKYRFNHRSLEVTKDGNLSSKLCFEAGKEYTSLYKTPYGEILLTTCTKQYSLTQNNNTIRIFVSYQILSEGETVSDNEIEILINEQ